VTLINPGITRSNFVRWREALSMCRWICLAMFRRRSCAVAVMNEKGPMVVVFIRSFADLRELIKEMEQTAYSLEIRLTGKSG
jgi:hypothetical protein